MGGLFSKRETTPSLPPITEQDKAILQLKTQRDKMKMFIKRKEKCMERERELARQLLADGRKDRALLLLKKKRMQDNIIDQTLKQLQTIENMVTELEFADMQQRVVEGLKQGNEALKKMNQLFDLDEIDKILEETKEGAEYQEEITSLLSGQLSSSDVQDCEAELEELLAKNAELEALPASTAEEISERDITLPEVPATPVAAKETTVEQREKSKRQKVALKA